ncbi:hypothetical protein AVEN_204159-1 [Araneus ventricosus]|uniref:Uncharacterized protein n=1 Tax=Araneus ventricosus TaxID=182803 RepID=A0A4Y2MIV3_ARAVE|nr:hypothetical protein AVEN_204159-1 [Araneus ventricosus]
MKLKNSSEKKRRKTKQEEPCAEGRRKKKKASIDPAKTEAVKFPAEFKGRKLRPVRLPMRHLTILSIPNVTIRPVLNGAVPFSGSLSRCPQAQLRNTQMSRFKKESNPR